MEQEQDVDVTQLREYWLQRAARFLMDHMQRCGVTPVPVRVSCGWPTSGGLGAKRTVIGQCAAPVICKDGVPQIFISPRLANEVVVLGTLLHELVHAAVGCEHGHKKPFSQAGRKVGLDGPPTSMGASKQLEPLLLDFVRQVGPYPHAAIVPPPKQERPGSRLRLYECACNPPVKARVASDEFWAWCGYCHARFHQVS
jgi:hypothetical protein